MGPDAFLAVEQAVVLDHNLDRAREVATAHVAGYLAMAPHGFGDEDIVLPRPTQAAASRRTT